VGDSVARASEARVSMIRLSQRSWIGLSTCCLRKAAPINVTKTATRLTVS